MWPPPLHVQDTQRHRSCPGSPSVSPNASPDGRVPAWASYWWQKWEPMPSGFVSAQKWAQHPPQESPGMSSVVLEALVTSVNPTGDREEVLRASSTQLFPCEHHSCGYRGCLAQCCDNLKWWHVSCGVTSWDQGLHVDKGLVHIPGRREGCLGLGYLCDVLPELLLVKFISDK
jgi:hypothetical protein